jgi:hypothetical protein
MAKTTSRKNAAKHEPADELIEQPSLATTNLSSVDLMFLQRVVRFLVNVLDPAYADKARREGYSSKEHALGWQIWRTAAGETRPFEHWLRGQDVSDGTDGDGTDQRRLLQEIDDFENTWFPRTRAIIRRVVPQDRRERFAAAFFKDLVQQPLGPAVVGSVGTCQRQVRVITPLGRYQQLPQPGSGPLHQSPHMAAHPLGETTRVSPPRPSPSFQVDVSTLIQLLQVFPALISDPSNTCQPEYLTHSS